MSTINTSSSDISFRVRPLGFDRGEVQAFIGNLLNDYAQVTRELDRLRIEMAALREHPPEARPAPPAALAPAATPQNTAAAVATASAKEVERILAAAERIAEEIRLRAQQEADELRTHAQHDSDLAVREAAAQAAATLRDADTRAASALADAETRAAELVDGAAQQVVALDRQAAAIRSQCLLMRDAIRSATAAAGEALRHIGEMDEDRVPTLQVKSA